MSVKEQLLKSYDNVSNIIRDLSFWDDELKDRLTDYFAEFFKYAPWLELKNFSINPDILSKDEVIYRLDIVNSIKLSNSMLDDEKNYWAAMILSMNKEQAFRLLTIIQTADAKLEEIDTKIEVHYERQKKAEESKYIKWNKF